MCNQTLIIGVLGAILSKIWLMQLNLTATKKAPIILFDCQPHNTCSMCDGQCQSLLRTVTSHLTIEVNVITFKLRHENCLIYVGTYWYTTVCLNGVPIYFDFKKVFDSVAHNELLLKLWSFGIQLNLWKWFRGYLNSRMQCVTTGSSTHLKLKHVCQELTLQDNFTSTECLDCGTLYLPLT